MSRTRIRKLRLRDFQQFRDVELDFTNPETGQANDRICLIGPNGTGKSTILRIIHRRISESGGSFPATFEVEHDAKVITLDPELALPIFPLRPGGSEILVMSPPETFKNVGLAMTVPKTNLNEALGLFQDFPVEHIISSETISEMWRILIFLVKKRENDRQDFENRPENLEKTKAQLIREFDATNPPVLEKLALLWNRILEPLGLELDVAGAKIPIQLTENLEAYVQLRGSKQRIGYHLLSTGTRNFLFRIGHLFLLYFNRKVERGFVFVDEPENSLFPDFLFQLMETYEDILRDPHTGETHTQLFVATHNPIVAAQFEPHERVILEWEDGFVQASKGTAPKGDDPNDLLLKDFHLSEVMGPAGRKKYQEYLQLRRQLRTAPEEKKGAIIQEAAEIAGQYGFEAPRS